jgi:hypothetical protein
MLDVLKSRAETARDARTISDEAATIRGVWNTSYVIELAETSSRLHLHYVVVQTVKQGCCYYEPVLETPGVSESLIGLDAIDSALGVGAWRIAALDAVFAELCRQPDDMCVIDGSNITKARARADVVAREVERVLGAMALPSERPARVVNVGVVGDFLSALNEHPEVEVFASDYYQQIVGRTLRGVKVEHGSMTPRLVAEADVALVTGMTLANGTLDEILGVARKSDTAVVLFAQTGAHFAEVYCETGVTAVISEPLPFYLSGDGPCRIDLFRAARR